MTTFRKTLLSAVAAMSMGAAALGAYAQTAAQNQVPDGRHGHAINQEERAKAGAEQRAKRIAKLHDELKITPAQEQAWNTFVASMKPAVRADRGDRQDRAALARLPAPERMAKHIELQKQRIAAMEQRLGTLSKFYAVLTPEQKKTFDEKAARFQGRGGKHGGHRGGWQRGGDTERG